MGWRGSRRCRRTRKTAERLFQKTLELEPEPQVKAWTLVYLGQLELAAGEREQAGKYFQSALQVEGASEKARKTAQQGMQQSSKQQEHRRSFLE